MNAINFLKNEHKKIKTCFKKIKEQSNFKKQSEEFKTFSKMLLRHEKMEQTLWYPVLEKYNLKYVDKIIEHLICEEKDAKKTIQAMVNLKSDKEWKSKFTTLNTDVVHHATEEETKLFPTAAKLLPKDILEEIGKKMVEYVKQH